jgi:hypothetical protein
MPAGIVLNTSIGQGDLLASPLQLCVMMARVAWVRVDPSLPMALPCDHPRSERASWRRRASHSSCMVFSASVVGFCPVKAKVFVSGSFGKKAV